MHLRLGEGYIFLNTLKNDFKRVWSFLFVKVFTALIFIVNISSWALAWYIKAQVNTPQMALHFTVDFGIDYYSESRKIFIIPLLAFFLFAINSSLLIIFSKNKDISFVAYLLMSTSLLTNLILFASLLSVYFLNFK